MYMYGRGDQMHFWGQSPDFGGLPKYKKTSFVAQICTSFLFFMTLTVEIGMSPIFLRKMQRNVPDFHFRGPVTLVVC